MSAFICSPNHVSTISSYLYRDKYNKLELSEIASTLAKANIESIKTRYKDLAGKEANSFISNINSNDEYISLCQSLTDNYATNPVQIIKLAHSFEYQSCEYDGWKTSQAKEILDSIVETATHNIPDYDSAKWSI
jgi:hypothetical protein